MQRLMASGYGNINCSAVNRTNRVAANERRVNLLLKSPEIAMPLPKESRTAHEVFVGVPFRANLEEFCLTLRTWSALSVARLIPIPM